MNFNTPTFKERQTKNTSPITPLVVATNISQFFDSTKLDKQLEKAIIKKGDENLGFQNDVFEAMMRSVGWQTTQAWCAYYVKLIMMQMFSFDRDFLARYFTGSAQGNLETVNNLNKVGKKRYLAIYSGTPQVGDIFVLQNVKSPGKGHTGLVLKNIDGNKIQTLEGNTNFQGSREGDKTESLTRDLTIGGISLGQRVIGFIRRNWTNQELERLTYDEDKQTFVFKLPQSSIVPTTTTPTRVQIREMSSPKY